MTQDVVGFSPFPPLRATTGCVVIAEGCVLHHCSYGDVNGWLAVASKQSSDQPRRGRSRHRIRRRSAVPWAARHTGSELRAPGGPLPARPQRGQRPASFHVFVRVSRRLPARWPTLRTATLWNGRGQPCELGTNSVTSACGQWRELPTTWQDRVIYGPRSSAACSTPRPRRRSRYGPPTTSSAPQHADRPWVGLCMVMSLDGSIAVDGASGHARQPERPRRAAHAAQHRRHDPRRCRNGAPARATAHRRSPASGSASSPTAARSISTPICSRAAPDS